MNLKNVLEREVKEDKELLNDKLTQIKYLFGLAIGFGGLLSTGLFIWRCVL